MCTKQLPTVTSKSLPQQRYQMVDIARLAGVSISTVSRALSDHRLIKAETRERIQELARSLNYQVNSSAANLRKKDIQTIGVVFLGDSLQHISDPFILSLIGHIADELDSRGLRLLLQRAASANHRDIAQLYDSGQVAGLLIIGQAMHHDELNQLSLRNIPMVVWGANLPTSRYCTVGGDNELGGYLATRHLLTQACRHIAFLGDVRHPEIELRYRGHLRALHEAKLEADTDLQVPVLFGDKELYATIQTWIQRQIPFDAVFATSDVAALTIISALREAGRRVPTDVKVVGYDDIQIASLLHPTLSTIRQPTLEAAQAMVERLAQQMAGTPCTSLMLETKLAVRQSSQPGT
jgi:DNA-binding LacI/PurR family transcriptional regulator